MRWKEWVQYVAYAAVFFYLHFLEARLGIYAFSLPFLMALTYNKRNLLIVLPLYFLSAFAFQPTWDTALIAGVPTLGLPLAYFVHFKVKKPLKMPFVSLYLFLFGIPTLVLGGTGVGDIVRKAVGAVGAQVCAYACITLLYCVLVRRFRYPLTAEEAGAFGFAAFLLGLGSALMRLGWFRPFYLLLASGAALFAAVRKESVLPFAFALGLGGAVAGGDPDCLALSLVYGGVALILAGTPLPLTAAAVVIAHGLYGVFFRGEMAFLTLIAPAVGGAVACLVPRRWIAAGATRWGKSAESQTARALVNRERNQVAGQIGELGHIFSQMEEVLAAECDEQEEEITRVRALAAEVERGCCAPCSCYASCCKTLGGAPRAILEGVALSALENGHAGILDMPPFLSSVCRKPGAILEQVNGGVDALRAGQQEKRRQDEGRRLLGRQMGGMGEILAELKKDVGRTLKYDTEREKQLLRALSAVDILGGDAIVYGAPTPSLTLSIPEGECENPLFLSTVNRVMGTEMAIIQQEKGVNGMVSVRLERAPVFRVVYGERTSGAVQGEENGDQVHALRLPGGKVMLILSDGMGQGEHAGRNSRYAVCMIEGFYRLGFDHATIMRSVSRLFSAKQREEFDAVDVALIDTYTGACDFIKLGGRESFVLRAGEVDTVACGSLPLGILDEAQAKVESRVLSEGAFIVMASDGVLDALGVECVQRLLAEEHSRNPDSIARHLMENVLRLRQGEKRDDASVLVAKLMRNE